MTQFYPPFEVGYKISYMLPLVIILFFRASEELIQNYKIKRKDDEFNNKIF